MITSFSSAHRSLFGSALLTMFMAMLMTTLAGCQQDVLTSDRESQIKGIRLYQEGNYADAAGAFRNSIRRDSRDYVSQYFLGASYEQLHQYQQAIQAYKTSLDTQERTLAGKADEAGRLRTINALAIVISKSDNGDAETNLVEQRARASQSGREYLLLAKIYQHEGDVDSALDAYNRAAILDDKDFAIAKEYGLYLEQAGQPRKAEQPLRRAYALRSKDADVIAALRRIGIVPGPGLRDEKDLAAPSIPKGPLPEVHLRIPGREAAPAASRIPPTPVDSAPRD